jgi:hypothetical protein
MALERASMKLWSKDFPRLQPNPCTPQGYKMHRFYAKGTFFQSGFPIASKGDQTTFGAFIYEKIISVFCTGFEFDPSLFL